MSLSHPEETRIIFLGSKSIGLKVLELLISEWRDCLVSVITIDDSLDSRSELPAFRALCAKASLDLQISLGPGHTEELIAASRGTLGIVVGWYSILGPRILAALHRGFVGLHYSKLPKYRGGSPLVWTMIRGEEKAGFSIFQFSENMDAGPIWAQGEVPIADGDSIGDVLGRLEGEALKAWRDVLPQILLGKATPQPQEGEASYCTQRRESDGLIDWTQSAEEVLRFVRAQSRPYPGAFTHLDEEKVRIFEAEKDDRTWIGMPGAVLLSGDEGVLISCGKDSALWVRRAQIRGQDRPAREVFDSRKLRLSKGLDHE